MNIRLLARMGVLIALGFITSHFSAIPFLGAKLFPAQHAINVVAGAILGPWYGAVTALCIALVRIGFGTGTLLAIPGSVFGALLAGLLYQRMRSPLAAMAGEVMGTGVLGALSAYPIAVAIMGHTKAAAAGATFFMLPFASSSLAGALLGGAVLAALNRATGMVQRNA